MNQLRKRCVVLKMLGAVDHVQRVRNVRERFELIGRTGECIKVPYLIVDISQIPEQHEKVRCAECHDMKNVYDKIPSWSTNTNKA